MRVRILYRSKSIPRWFLLCLVVTVILSQFENISRFQLYSSLSSETSAVIEDEHQSHKILLDLSPWEQATKFGNQTLLEFNDTSKIPPQYCSIGTFTRYGTLVTPKLGTDCAPLEAYQETQAFVRQFLKDDSTCDICRIFDLLTTPKLPRHGPQNITTLTFWGDSLQHQAFAGLICEFHRRNYPILSDNINATRCRPTTCLQFVRTVEIGNPHLLTLKLYFQYRPSPRLVDLTPILDQMMQDGTNVLVFNFGIHYAPDRSQVYRETLATIMEALRTLQDRLWLVAFRETAIQHWNASGGEFEWKTGNNCTPSFRDDQWFAWRNRAFQRVANAQNVSLLWADPLTPQPQQLYSGEKESTQEITILPFGNFSSNFHYLHPNECTHFCYTPFFWNPLWRSLRYAIEDKFSHHQET